MKKSIFLFELSGFAATTLFGTLLHFAYDWFGKSPIIAPFSAVNESTFEHMKLLFWPMLIYAAIQWTLTRPHDGFLCIKLRGIILGITSIPILFYSYNGIIGKSPAWVNIAIFFISAALGFLYELKLFKLPPKKCNNGIALLLLIFICALFMIFTLFPPHIGIFMDPVTGAY